MIQNNPIARPQSAYGYYQQTTAGGSVPMYPTVPNAPDTSAGSGDMLALTTSIASTAQPYLPGALAGHATKSVLAKARTAARRASTRARYNSYSGYGSRSSYSSYGNRRYTTRSSQVGTGASGRLFGNLGHAIKTSVIANGLISLVTNGYGVYKKQQTVAVAGSNVVGDLASGAVGGAAGAAASAVGTAILGAMVGPGLLLTVASFGLGIAGYMVADGLLRQTSFFQGLKAGTQKLLGG